MQKTSPFVKAVRVWLSKVSASNASLFFQFSNEILAYRTENVKHYKWLLSDTRVAVLHVGWNAVEVTFFHDSFFTANSENRIATVDDADLFMWMRMQRNAVTWECGA